MLTNIGNSTILYLISRFFFDIGETSIILWSNIIAYVIYKVLRDKKTVNIFKAFPLYCGYVFIPSLIAAIAILAFNIVGDENLSSNQNIIRNSQLIVVWVSFGFILLNVVLYLLVYRITKQMKMDVATRQGAVNKTKALILLVKRLKYYPL